MTYYSKLVAGLHLDFFLNISILFTNGSKIPLHYWHSAEMANIFHFRQYIYNEFEQCFIASIEAAKTIRLSLSYIQKRSHTLFQNVRMMKCVYALCREIRKHFAF